MTTTPLRFTPLSGMIGASVEGFDPAAHLSDEAVRSSLEAGLAEHLVLVFRGLDPLPEEQIELARVFGTPEPPEDYNPAHPDHPEICVFDSEGGYKADRWHTDLTWKSEITLGAVLCMRQAPDAGGDTVWASCQAAYDGLSGGMKQLIEGRRAHHDIGPLPEHGSDHPVVVTHPSTGRKALFVNDIFTRRIDNLPEDESRTILPFLIRSVSRPEYTYRHRWSVGDVIVWDNRVTQHYALSDFEGRRVVHRVGIKGWVPA
jgi:taurine dioxygenase